MPPQSGGIKNARDSAQSDDVVLFARTRTLSLLALITALMMRCDCVFGAPFQIHSPNYWVMSGMEQISWDQWFTVARPDSESKDIGFAEEATMLGYGLIGTVVVIVLVVWILRAL